jgi:glutathione synthase/RimK-type ligase-like ATP-grasp enzyme
LKKIFIGHGFDCEYYNFCNLPDLVEIKNSCVLYTSSEDSGNYYKGFIEDVIFNLERNGVNIVPGLDLLRAHNNKVYMELLRSRVGQLWNDNLQSRVFGSLEELERVIDDITFPIVVKKFDGALSRGVFLAKDKDDLINKVKSISRIKFTKEEIKDKLRPLKHKGYIKESIYRNKFILQQFIPGLANDWKVLVYGERVFILTRHTRDDDFRASGSHCNYLAGSESKLPEGIFDYAEKIRDSLNVPHLSLDIVHDGQKFHLVEFQALYFGTSTINMSDVFFQKIDNQWEQLKNDFSLEQLYADAVSWFLKK